MDRFIGKGAGVQSQLPGPLRQQPSDGGVGAEHVLSCSPPIDCSGYATHSEIEPKHNGILEV